MSERIITEQQIKKVKRLAKSKSRTDKSLSYMQHLDAICAQELGVSRFADAKANLDNRLQPANTPLSLYLQACQDAYFEI